MRQGKVQKENNKQHPFLYTAFMAGSQTFLNPMQEGTDDPNSAKN
jgi:hypothetical protein